MSFNAWDYGGITVESARDEMKMTKPVFEHPTQYATQVRS